MGSLPLSPHIRTPVQTPSAPIPASLRPELTLGLSCPESGLEVACPEFDSGLVSDSFAFCQPSHAACTVHTGGGGGSGGDDGGGGLGGSKSDGSALPASPELASGAGKGDGSGECEGEGAALDRTKNSSSSKARRSMKMLEASVSQAFDL